MFEEIWNDIKTFFTTNVWNIVLFFAILIFGTILVKILINLSKKMLKRTGMEGITQGFIAAFIKIALYLVLVLALLSVIGVEIGGIVTALSAAVLAIGVALQNIIANVANGIVVVSTHMFKKGDLITVDKYSGCVTNINFLFTTITTKDNRRVTFPNSMLLNNEVINESSYEIRRVGFTFSVAYESDVELVKQIVVNVMKSNGCVILEKEPFCRLQAMSASSLDFAANCWCDTEDYWDVYYYVMENVYNEFKRNNISVPYNQIEMRERTDVVTPTVIGEGLPERVEKVRVKNKNIDLENVDFTEIFKPKNKKDKESSYNKKVDKNKSEKKTNKKANVKTTNNTKQKTKKSDKK